MPVRLGHGRRGEMTDERGARDGSGLPAPESDGLPTGPAVGDLVPDFSLPDQSGLPVTLSQVLEGSRALVVFYRSARW